MLLRFKRDLSALWTDRYTALSQVLTQGWAEYGRWTLEPAARIRFLGNSG